uniref:Conotoxin VnMSGL-0122 n=1 Tax=Conus ventricosus TaxID=117992 RepID=O3620_CONVE|nr:RecName: Full=Conotoxin VnMSGL-0122; Flags: Precursor [Conus ventricosus]AAG60505.1 conotoxin scaffold VI/VII precursor [Conus ventricosus]
MSGLGIMVLALLLLVFMATSHQDGGGKQATQRDAINVRRRRSITRRVVTETCKEYCEDRDKTCCGLENGQPDCANLCLG